MPFKTHPELAKMFRQLPAPTCPACLLCDADITNNEAVIQTFEQLAMKAGYLTHANCAVCNTNKHVIRPSSVRPASSQ